METKVMLRISFLSRDALRTNADQSGTHICLSKLRGQSLWKNFNPVEERSQAVHQHTSSGNLASNQKQSNQNKLV